MNGALGMSLRRQARGSQRALVALGSYAQCSALGASLRGARPQQQQLVSAFARIFAHTINPMFPHTMGTLLFRFANCTAENAIGSKSETQNLNRIGNSLSGSGW